jgi:transposase-like protein
MRYLGSEKLEIIRLVEQSPLPVRRTLATLGILPMTFYRWYARLQAGGPAPLTYSTKVVPRVQISGYSCPLPPELMISYRLTSNRRTHARP